MISKYKRLAKALVNHRGEWVSNKQLANEARISTIGLGRLMIPVVRGELAEKRLRPPNGRYHVEYSCVAGDVELLSECMLMKNQISVGLDGVVHPERSEAWFTQAARLMGE